MAPRNPTLSLVRDWEIVESAIPHGLYGPLNEMLFTQGNGSLSVRGSSEFSIPGENEMSAASSLSERDLIETLNAGEEGLFDPLSMNALQSPMGKLLFKRVWGIGNLNRHFRATYFNGVYDEVSSEKKNDSNYTSPTFSRHRKRFAGSSLVKIPDMTCIDIYIDGERICLEPQSSVEISPDKKYDPESSKSDWLSKSFASPTSEAGTCDQCNGQTKVRHYSRVMDLKSGEVRTRFTWTSKKGYIFRIDCRRFVSFTRRDVITFLITVRLHYGEATEVRIVSRLQFPEDSALLLEQITTEEEPGTYSVSSRTAHSGIDVYALCREQATMSYPTLLGKQNAGNTNCPGTNSPVTSNHVSQLSIVPQISRKNRDVISTTTTILGAGSSMRFSKTGVYAAGKHYMCENFAEKCKQMLGKVLGLGYEALLTEQMEYLGEYWQLADIKVSAPPLKHIQSSIRYNILQLLMNAGQTKGTSIAVKGISELGGGQYTWTTEVIIGQFFASCMPSAVRSFIQFRIDTLPQATEKALEYGLPRGAIYPRCTLNGYESWTTFSGQVELHINAGIVFLIKLYHEVTEDVEILLKGAAKVVFATALTWIHWGKYESGVFHLYMVTGPDDYNVQVNDNYYTNLMAQKHLNYAIWLAESLLIPYYSDVWEQIAKELGMKNPEEDLKSFKKASTNMAFPYDAILRVHLQDQSLLKKPPWTANQLGYCEKSMESESRTIDSSGSNAALTLGKFQIPEKEKMDIIHREHAILTLFELCHPVNIYRHRICKTADVILAQVIHGDHFTQDEKMANFLFYEGITTYDFSSTYAILSIAASELGLKEKATSYFERALMVDLYNVVGNSSMALHVSCMAGSWAAIVHGFAGMRVIDGYLHFNPWLPDGWTGYSFQIQYSKVKLSISVSRCNVTYRIIEGLRCKIVHGGVSSVHLIAERPVTVRLSMDIRSLNYDTLVFDLNSVIMNIEEDHYNSWKIAIEALFDYRRKKEKEKVKELIEYYKKEASGDNRTVTPSSNVSPETEKSQEEFWHNDQRSIEMPHTSSSDDEINFPSSPLLNRPLKMEESKTALKIESDNSKEQNSKGNKAPEQHSSAKLQKLDLDNLLNSGSDISAPKTEECRTKTSVNITEQKDKDEQNYQRGVPQELLDYSLPPNKEFTRESYVINIRNHPHLRTKQYERLAAYLATCGVIRNNLSKYEIPSVNRESPKQYTNAKTTAENGAPSSSRVLKKNNSNVEGGIDIPYGQPTDLPGFDTIHAVANLKAEIFRVLVQSKGVQVVPGAVQLIENLRENGIAVGCVSSSRNGVWLARKANVEHLFDVFLDGRGVWSVSGMVLEDATRTFTPFDNMGYRAVANEDGTRKVSVNVDYLVNKHLGILSQTAVSSGKVIAESWLEDLPNGPPSQHFSQSQTTMTSLFPARVDLQQDNEHVSGSLTTEGGATYCRSLDQGNTCGEDGTDGSATLLATQQGTNVPTMPYMDTSQKAIQQLEWVPDLEFFQWCAQLLDSQNSRTVVIIDAIKDVSTSAVSKFALVLCTNGDNEQPAELSKQGVCVLDGHNLQNVNTETINYVLSNKNLYTNSVVGAGEGTNVASKSAVPVHTDQSVASISVTTRGLQAVPPRSRAIDSAVSVKSPIGVENGRAPMSLNDHAHNSLGAAMNYTSLTVGEFLSAPLITPGVSTSSNHVWAPAASTGVKPTEAKAIQGSSSIDSYVYGDAFYLRGGNTRQVSLGTRKPCGGDWIWMPKMSPFDDIVASSWIRQPSRTPGQTIRATSAETPWDLTGPDGSSTSWYNMISQHDGSKISDDAGMGSQLRKTMRGGTESGTYSVTHGVEAVSWTSAGTRVAAQPTHAHAKYSPNNSNLYPAYPVLSMPHSNGTQDFSVNPFNLQCSFNSISNQDEKGKIDAENSRRRY